MLFAGFSLGGGAEGDNPQADFLLSS